MLSSAANTRAASNILQTAKLDDITDGKIEVIGPDFADVDDKGSMDMGILIQVAGRQMQPDFEPVLERQVHYFVNGASGIQHVGQRDIAWIRISNGAAEKGFSLEHFGTILHARFHDDFGAIVDKVQVTIFTEPKLHEEWLNTAREAYDFRNKRLADLTDDKVDEFYSCTLCQSFAPDHVCVVSPGTSGPVRRLQLAGLQSHPSASIPPAPTSPSSWANWSTSRRATGKARTNTPRSARTARYRKCPCTPSWKTR